MYVGHHRRYPHYTTLLNPTPHYTRHPMGDPRRLRLRAQPCYAIGEGWHLVGEYEERLATGYGCRDGQGAFPP